MAITKERKSQLIKWANEVIGNSPICKNGEIVSDSYNGQIAAFSVSVALSGLKPAVAIYNSGKGSLDVDKKKIIELLAAMYSKDKNEQTDAMAFFNLIMVADATQEVELRRVVIEYGIALKLAVRTFKFKGA